MISPLSASDEFATIPANQFFGFTLVSRDTDQAEVSLRIKPDHIQEEGIVHGGVTTALADTAAVHALYQDLPRDKTMTSIEFKLNFLRPVRDTGGELRASARVVKRGKTVALCDVDVHQQDHLVAKGLFTYLIMARNG